MLTPLKHFIILLVLNGVPVSMTFTMDCSIYVHLTMNLTPDFFVFLTWRTDVGSVLLRLPGMGMLIFIANFCLRNWVHSRYNRSTGVLTTPRHLIPPPLCHGAHLAHLFLWLVICTCVSRLVALWYLSRFPANRCITWSVEMRIWWIEIGIVLVLYAIGWGSLIYKLNHITHLTWLKVIRIMQIIFHLVWSVYIYYE
jgi:hypothetical protein